jgi:hypothetical protein
MRSDADRKLSISLCLNDLTRQVQALGKPELGTQPARQHGQAVVRLSRQLSRLQMQMQVRSPPPPVSIVSQHSHRHCKPNCRPRRLPLLPLAPNLPGLSPLMRLS